MRRLVGFHWRDALHDLVWIAAIGLAPFVMSIAVLIAQGELNERPGILFDDAQFAIYATTLIGATFLNIVNARGDRETHRKWISYLVLGSVVLIFFSSGLYSATTVESGSIAQSWLRGATILTYIIALTVAFISGVFYVEI